GGTRRRSPEPSKTPADEESLDGSGGNAGTNWIESDLGSSCRDIVIPVQPTAPRIGVADEAVCASAPRTFVQSVGLSRRRQSGAVSHGASLGLVEQPHRGSTVDGEKQDAVQNLTWGREGPTGDETNGVASCALIEAGNSEVNTLAPPLTHTTDFDRQVVSYLGNGGVAVWRTESTTVQTVDIAFPAEGRSSPLQDEATPRRPHLDLKPHRSGAGGGSSSDGPPVRYKMKGQANDDEFSRVSSAGACIRKRLAHRSVSSVLRQCHPPPLAPSVMGGTVRGGSGQIDGEGPDVENRIVPFSLGHSVVNKVASETAKGVPAVGGTPPLWGKGDALRLEKSREEEGGAQADTCQQQQVLGPTAGSEPAGTRLCLPSRACVGQESTGTCPNPAKLLQATLKGACLPEKQESHGEGAVSAEPRTMRELSPQTAAVCTQDVVCVDDQPDDKVLENLVGKPAKKKSRSEGRRDADGRTTLPRTLSGEHFGHNASDRQPEDGTLVPLEGHGRDVGEPRMPVWRGTAAPPPAEESRARSALQALPRRRLDAFAVTAYSRDSPGPSTSHSSPCQSLPLPCTRSLLQLEATGEAVVHGNGREKGEVGPAEPMVPVVPLGGAILESSTTRTAPTGPLAASSAVGFSRQPASSEALPISPPSLRSKQPIVAISSVGVQVGSSAGLDSSVELFSPPTADKDASSPLPPPLAHYRRPYWSTGVDAASQAGTDREDAEDSCTTPVAPPDKDTQGESEAAAETAPAIAKHEWIANSAIHDRQTSREGQQQQQQQPHGLEPAVDLGSHVEPIARSSDQSDGSNFTRKGGLQRHLQRYPPPPGPPPSPIRALRRGKTSPKTASSSQSRRHRERSTHEQACGRPTNQVVAAGTITISSPTTTEDEANNLYYRSPCPRKKTGRSMTADSQEDTALLDLAEVAVSWLPPPTPPPPEARRRRRQRASMPPPSPSCPSPNDCNVGGSTGPPPAPAPPRPRIDGPDGGKKDGRGEDSKKQSSTSRDSGRWTYGGCRSEMQQSGGTTALTATTTPADEHNGTDGRRRGEWASGELRGNRNLEERGGWAESDEGSAAKRRADVVLAR
ncbi:unnamed protein product, partial [Ectocarpus fasciculatus]